MTQECKTSDLRCFFGTFLVIWIYCISAFCIDLQKMGWERTTGTIVDYVKVPRGRSGTSELPVITFQTNDDNHQEITFRSDSNHGAFCCIGTDDIVVVYNPKNPSLGPETLVYVKEDLAFSGCFGLFTTLLGSILTVYFCMTEDSLGRSLGLRDHLAPESPPPVDMRAVTVTIV